MTEFEVKNGLLKDSLEIREDLRKVNFSFFTFVIAWMSIHVVPLYTEPPYFIVSLVCVLSLYITFLVYVTRWCYYVIKLDFIFVGQYIRDLLAVANFLTPKKLKK